MTGTLTRPLGELRFESGVPGGSETTATGKRWKNAASNALDHDRLRSRVRHPTNRDTLPTRLILSLYARSEHPFPCRRTPYFFPTLCRPSSIGRSRNLPPRLFIFLSRSRDVIPRNAPTAYLQPVANAAIGDFPFAPSRTVSTFPTEIHTWIHCVINCAKRGRIKSDNIPYSNRFFTFHSFPPSTNTVNANKLKNDTKTPFLTSPWTSLISRNSRFYQSTHHVNAYSKSKQMNRFR